MWINIGCNFHICLECNVEKLSGILLNERVTGKLLCRFFLAGGATAQLNLKCTIFELAQCTLAK